MVSIVTGKAGGGQKPEIDIMGFKPVLYDTNVDDIHHGETTAYAIVDCKVPEEMRVKNKERVCLRGSAG